MGDGRGPSISSCFLKALMSSKKSCGGAGNSGPGSIASAGASSSMFADMTSEDDASDVQEAESLPT